MVVDQSSVAPGDANATFSLYGGMVDSGAYEYELAKGSGDDNWYLQSNGQATGTAKNIANIPAIHLSNVKTDMNELRKRMGELRENSPQAKNGAWVRTYAKHLKVDDSVESRMNLYGAEAGYDRQLYSDCEQKL